jgi:hypothetical protein
MLSEFFEAHARICAIRSGPSGELLESFANQLFESGMQRYRPADISDPPNT